MNRAVLDASILLAIIRDETYEEAVLDLLPDSVISAVNLAEVLTRVFDLRLLDTVAVDRLLQSLGEVKPFTEAQAVRAAHLRQHTHHAGLSLGDRACLSLAMELGLPAYTVDRSWLRVDVGCRIHCLR